MMAKNSGGVDGLSNVLLTLEEAARTPNMHLLDLRKVFGPEKWSIFRDFYAVGSTDPFSEEVDSQFAASDVDSIMRFMASAFELDDIVSILSVLLEVANGLRTQVRASRERIAAKLLTGIKSLPDELLSQIFQFTVWDQGEIGGMQAVQLSQVSQTFRTIALQTRGLWTTIHSCYPPHQLETFLHRSGPNEDFHAYIHLVPHAIEIGESQFATICQPTMSRWKTLTLTRDKQHWCNDPVQPYYGGSAKLVQELLHFFSDKGVQLPSLEEFNIYGHPDDICRDVGHVYYEWAPNLRIFRGSYFLPDPFRISSVSTFIFTQSLTVSEPTLIPLFEILREMPNLSTFEMEFHHAAKKLCYPIVPRLEMPSILSFHLRIFELDLDALPRQEEVFCVIQLLDQLRMPSLEEYTILVNLGESDNSAGRTQKFVNLSHALLPTHLSDYNKMTSMSYKIWVNGCVALEPLPMAPSPLDSIPLNVILNRILHIPTVTFSSSFGVMLSFDKTFMDNHRDTQNLPFNSSGQCRLRELRYVGCNTMTLPYLIQNVSSLQRLGVWDDIEHIIVEDCAHLSYDEVEGVVGKEKLQFLHHD